MFGCHPSRLSDCDCDWDTDENGHDYFVQCDECAELWEKFPNAVGGYEKSSLQNDTAEVLEILLAGDIRIALFRALDLGLLHRAPALGELIRAWLPVLFKEPDAIEMMGDALMACADTLQISC